MNTSTSDTAAQEKRARSNRKFGYFLALLIVGGILYTAYGLHEQMPTDQLIWRMIDAVGLGLLVTAITVVGND